MGLVFVDGKLLFGAGGLLFSEDPCWCCGAPLPPPATTCAQCFAAPRPDPTSVDIDVQAWPLAATSGNINPASCPCPGVVGTYNVPVTLTGTAQYEGETAVSLGSCDFLLFNNATSSYQWYTCACRLLCYALVKCSGVTGGTAKWYVEGSIAVQFEHPAINGQPAPYWYTNRTVGWRNSTTPFTCQTLPETATFDRYQFGVISDKAGKCIPAMAAFTDYPATLTVNP